MSQQDTFAALKTYLETQPAAQKALSQLREGVEIGIIIDKSLECAVMQKNGLPKVEQRPAEKPDVIFALKPETVFVLQNSPSNTVGDIGIAILKEVIAGNIQIRVPGNILNLAKNGYMQIIKEGGSQFLGFLAVHGLTNANKILAVMRKLKKNS